MERERERDTVTGCRIGYEITRQRCVATTNASTSIRLCYRHIARHSGYPYCFVWVGTVFGARPDIYSPVHSFMTGDSTMALVYEGPGSPAS